MKTETVETNLNPPIVAVVPAGHEKAVLSPEQQQVRDLGKRLQELEAAAATAQAVVDELAKEQAEKREILRSVGMDLASIRARRAASHELPAITADINLAKQEVEKFKNPIHNATVTFRAAQARAEEARLHPKTAAFRNRVVKTYNNQAALCLQHEIDGMKRNVETLNQAAAPLRDAQRAANQILDCPDGDPQTMIAKRDAHTKLPQIIEALTGIERKIAVVEGRIKLREGELLTLKQDSADSGNLRKLVNRMEGPADRG